MENILNSNAVKSWKSTGRTKKAYYATFPDGKRFVGHGYKTKATWLSKGALINAIKEMIAYLWQSYPEVKADNCSYEQFEENIMNSMTIHELTE